MALGLLILRFMPHKANSATPFNMYSLPQNHVVTDFSYVSNNVLPKEYEGELQLESLNKCNLIYKSLME